MILKFFKEYLAWYITYMVLLFLFYATFYLYQLPMAYFGMSLVFNLVLFSLFSAFQYYQFSRKMLTLRDLRDSDSFDFNLRPSDLAYRELLMKQKRLSDEDYAQIKSQLEQSQAMIKLWSHQMKVPLSALSLMSQTNRLEQSEVDQQLTYLQQYVETLLTYLKFHQHKDDFRFEQVSVRRLVLDLVKKNAVSCLAKELSVTVDGDWLLVTDGKWLSFALGQILDNAIKYSKKGGQIHIQIRDQEISLQDQGIGILEEDLPRLFEEGFTGFNGHEHKKATGLGLYISKQILDSLTLDIKIDSQIDIGTTVRILKTEKRS
ncbi:sensor histidine kinase [Streptococcus loxodontisalivarius]|uniref:histidine kinase n=1 Tax=Streptococcus loxodontisalivarius TaxID=1349415 RepID=A0ABS2PQM5_9STRE|nr:sensor histidine kinase [Streptococcus loxodontisalivarius]MBM7642290.1 signal transduction histidine kinase [Streptococcus loxodontisalivarius]